MIHNYYDELFVRVRTQKWTTDWFMFQIGLFQGCPLSVVLFLVVFNVLLDLLKTKQDLGYQLKNTDLKQLQKAYADDLTLIAGNVKGCKELLHLVETFLKWTRTMNAKPSKCRSLAMKRTRILQPSGKVSTPYTPYDPQLSIDGREIPFIHQTAMRFLGQDIYKDLSDKEARGKVEDKLKNLLQKSDGDQVNSIGKLWIYENHIVSRISWEFIILLPHLLCQEPSGSCNTLPQELGRSTKMCKSINPVQKEREQSAAIEGTYHPPEVYAGRETPHREVCCRP